MKGKNIIFALKLPLKLLTLKVKIGSEYNDIGRTCVETFLTLSSLVSSALLGLSASGQTPKPE